MATIRIPYERTHMELQVPDDRLLGVLESKAHQYLSVLGEAALVRQALRHPIASPPLREIVQGKKKIVIITSDHTRPVPTRITAPEILAEIRAGNPEADVTFLIATGFHRSMTQKELEEKFGPELLETERIIMHDCRDDASMITIGKLPSGGDIVINQLAMEADLLMSEGFIEPHFFAGFSGGRKSVLPGIVSRTTVLANHCSEFIAHENARAGILDGNPIHMDMVSAARQAHLAFILNVVIDAEKRIIKAFAGEMEEAHLAGCHFVKKLASVTALPADIVVTSNGGYPLDQNVYQAIKGMSAAEASCKPGGVIIIAAACNDGHGGQAFYDWFREAKGGAAEVMCRIMEIDKVSTVADQWEAQIAARIQLKHLTIIVSNQCDQTLIENMYFKSARSLAEAMTMAEAVVGKDATVTVIPDGVSVIVEPAQHRE
jgi:nickel-dependent lactate racemase